MEKRRLVYPILIMLLMLTVNINSARAAVIPNPYYPQWVGQCTWWAAEMRPDLRFNLGNAESWARVSKARGYVVDNTPEIGAIAVWGPGIAGAHATAGHVAYVISVQDSTHFRVSEYNWKVSLGHDERNVTWVTGIQFIHTAGNSSPPSPDPVVSYTYYFDPPSPSSVSTVKITAGAAETAGHRQINSIIVEVNGQRIGTVSGSSGSVLWTTANLSPGSYVIRLRASVANWTGDVNYRDITYQIQGISSPPQRPSLTSPSSNSVLPQTADISLSWNTAVNATQYKVELWGGRYSSTMVPCDWQSGTSCHIGTMWPGTMSWHVKARNSVGQESDWSDTWSFTILGPTDTHTPTLTITPTPSITPTPLPSAPVAPSLSNPPNGASLPQSTNVTLSWNAASNATQYKVELWGRPYSLMTPCDWQSGTSCHIGTMWPGTMSWHIKARNASGQESNWSDTWSFTIYQEATPTFTPSPTTATPQPSFTGNIAPRCNRSPDGIGSNNAFDGNLSTFWTDGLGHRFRLELRLPDPMTITRILVWDRPQNSPDNNQINALIIRLSNGIEKRFDMNSQGARCIDVTLSTPQTIPSVTLIADDASGNNGLSEVEIWVGSKTGGPTCSNSGTMP